MNDSANFKRRMAMRIQEMTNELNALTFEELMLIRTSQLEGYGLEVKKALDFLNSIRPK